MDPTQLFVVSTVSREDIAERVRPHLPEEGIPNDPNTLPATDSRLTDEFCQQFADGMNEAESDTIGLSESVIEEHEERLAKSMAHKLARK